MQTGKTELPLNVGFCEVVFAFGVFNVYSQQDATFYFCASYRLAILVKNLSI